MKLIIDIDEKDYANIKDCPTDYEYSVALMTIANGTPVSNEGDLISRSELKKVLIEEYEAREHYIGEIILKAIDNAPTVEPTFGLFKEMLCAECGKRPQGEWIHYLGCGIGKAVCSECGQVGEIKKYCGNCGADMRKGGAE